MICIIYAISRNIPPNIWTNIKSIDNSNNRIHEYSLDDLTCAFSNSTISDNKTSQGFGVFMKISGTVYVITHFHIIGSVNVGVNAYFPNKRGTITKIPLTVFKTIPELDIALLKLESISHQQIVDYYTDENIANINDIINITNNINLIVSNINASRNKIINHSLQIEKSSIEIALDHLKSAIVPEIPLLKYTCDIDKYGLDCFDNDTLSGLSGSVLISGKLLLGMTVGYNNMKLEAIPMIIIYKLAQGMINNKDGELTSLYFNSKICTLNTDTFRSLTCHYVTDGKNIAYQSKIYKKDFKIKEGDLIYQINDNNFTKNGKIYDSQIGYEIPIDTYIMLNCYMNSTIKISLYRKQKMITNEIYGKKFDDVYDVNIFNNHKYLHWKGFIFTELSEEFMLNSISLGYNLTGNVFEQYNKITGSKNKIIILIDIDYKTLKDDISDSLKSIGLPYIKNINGYTMFVLDRIGTKKIINLEDLSNTLEINKKQKTTCHYNYNGNDYKLKIIE